MAHKPAAAAEAGGAASVAELGQRRVDRLVVRIATAATSCVGARRAHCPAIAAKPARRTFNALTKTPLAKLRMKDKWAAQSQAMIEGVSTAKAARRCGVHYTTAFRWRHRFLASLAGDKPKALSRHRRRRRDLHSGIVQGQAIRHAAKVAQARRQIGQTRLVC